MAGRAQRTTIVVAGIAISAQMVYMSTRVRMVSEMATDRRIGNKHAAEMAILVRFGLLSQQILPVVVVNMMVY
jgi:hypothetical protein